ncbi:AMP-binding enzyme [Paenibacillus sp. IHB B 3084]|uniref:AMP-binding enzyme n=1 Tax=Paenibacillus sp. IHB B 3084 TaxID=867076 RepID=UPI001F192E52|nr:hypothetical protein [Paenibacillus sp. IHB B 3084]
MKHDSVQECAAVASPDEIRGHIVKAYVVLKAGVEGSPELVKELQHHVKALTAPYKYPRKIEFIKSFPKPARVKYEEWSCVNWRSSQYCNCRL